jgi:hypothetical protein
MNYQHAENAKSLGLADVFLLFAMTFDSSQVHSGLADIFYVFFPKRRLNPRPLHQNNAHNPLY